MAKKRLNSLGKRPTENPEVREKYWEKIKAMLDEEHAILVTDQNLEAVKGRSYYISHHNIASEKCLIVMDCTATNQGFPQILCSYQAQTTFSLLGVFFIFAFIL